MTSLIALAARDGVPVRDVLVADASRRTRAVNAYVSGFGPTRRIVVYDTLLREAPPAEVVAVVAHELGHAKETTCVTGTLLGALGAAAGGGRAVPARRRGGLLRAAGVDRSPSRARSALLLAVVTVPAWSPRRRRRGCPGGSRPVPTRTRWRHRRPGHVRGDAAAPGCHESTSADPDPPRWEYSLLGRHPSTVERIAAARAYARDVRR